MLTLGGEAVAAGLDHAQRLEIEGRSDGFEEVGFLALDIDTVRLAFIGTQSERYDLVDHFREDGDQVAVAEAEHRVQVHCRTGFRQAGNDHAFHGFVFEQVARQLADGLVGRALARHAAVDPAGGVAGELGVGKRRQNEA